MKIAITGRQMTVRDSLKELTLSKLERFEKFFDDNTEVYVSFSIRRGLQMVEITISTPTTMFRSEEGDETFLAAIEDDDEFDEIAEIFEERLADIFEIDVVEADVIPEEE